MSSPYQYLTYSDLLELCGRYHLVVNHIESGDDSLYLAVIDQMKRYPNDPTWTPRALRNEVVKYLRERSDFKVMDSENLEKHFLVSSENLEKPFLGSSSIIDV